MILQVMRLIILLFWEIDIEFLNKGFVGKIQASFLFSLCLSQSLQYFLSEGIFDMEDRVN